MLRKIIFLTVLMGTVSIFEIHAFSRTNLFNPYDILLFPTKQLSENWQFTVGYEGAVHTKGFGPCLDHSVNVLQLWQQKQDGIAAFKGRDAMSAIGKYAQNLNIDDDDRAHGIYVPSAKLSIPVNAMFALRYHFPYGISLGVYLPYYVAHLHEVHWVQKHNSTFFEDILTPDMLGQIEKLGDLKLGGWKREGFGDLLIMSNWFGDFLQNKPWLRNVRLGARIGALFPTGHTCSENSALGLPFGYDAGAGILFAGTCNFFYTSGTRFGIDLEFLHLFGNFQNRRIKTNPVQTDLFLLTKTEVFKDPGFTQHYTLWLEQVHFWRGLSALCAYQYQKHNDDRYYLCTDIYNIETVNNAESVQEWTTQSIIANVTYDWFKDEAHRFKPHLMLFGKWGFNGKRAILADTLGIQMSVSW